MRRYIAAPMLLLAAGYAAAATIHDATTSLRDITAESKVVSRDMDILKKISTEFAQSYRFGNSVVYYKEPNLMRLESKAGLVSVKYVINGDKKKLNAGLIKKSWDVAKEPRQRQSIITIGLLAPSYVDLFNVTPSGTETVNGVKTEVYTLHYKVEPGGSFMKLSLDPVKRVVVRQRQFHGNGNLKYEIRFLEPRRYNGVWVPTRSEVYNGEGQRGAVTQMTSVRVNTGLRNDLFKL